MLDKRYKLAGIYKLGTICIRTLIILIFFTTNLFSQSIDTVYVFKSERNVPFKVYNNYWYNWDRHKCTNRYFDLSKINKQDSSIIFQKKDSYFKVYENRNGAKILEGFVPIGDNNLLVM